jgi:hypothetical protein
MDSSLLNVHWSQASATETSSAVDMATQIAIQEGKLNGRVDNEKGLYIRFYNKPTLNQRMTKVGFHQYRDEETGEIKRGPCNCYEVSIDEKRPIELIIRRASNEKIDGLAVHVTPGRPIFEDKIWIEKRIPNERDFQDTIANIFNEEAAMNDRMAPQVGDNLRYPRAWEAYQRAQRGEEAILTGTPVEELAKGPDRVMTASQAEEFRGIKCFTVEQLIEIPDSSGQRIMGWQSMKRRAKEWLEERAKRAIPELIQKLSDEKNAENQELRKLLEDQSKVIAQLQARILGPDGRPLGVVPGHVGQAVAPEQPNEIAQQLTASPAPRKRGRPAKAKTLVQER